MKHLCRALFFLFAASFAWAGQPIVDARFSGTGNNVQSGAVFTFNSGSTISVDAGATVTGLQRTNSSLTALAGITPSSYSLTLLPLTTRAAWFNAMAPASPATGDILYWNGTDWIDLGVGTTGQVLTVASGLPSWAGSAAGAPNDATYITQTANGTLTNEFPMGSLATGIVKNATTTGIPSIAVAGTDYVAPVSATASGLTMATARVLGRTTASTGAIEELTFSGVLDQIGNTRGGILERGASGWQIVTPGTAGYIWTSNGSGADPTWQAASAGFTNPMTTKGDLIVGATSGTATRLPATTDTFVLTLDSAQTLGVKWAAAPSGASGANPTASVGLSAVNGSASTFLRSDAAPALSASITPTWTGTHTFSTNFTLTNSTPKITYASSSSNSNQLTFQPSTANTGAQVNVVPSGTSVDSAVWLFNSPNIDTSGTQAFAFGGGFAGSTASAWNFGAFVLQQSTGTSWPIVFNTSNGSGRHVVLTLNTDATIKFNAYGAGTLTTDSSGNITATSDERLKSIQGDFTRGLSDLSKIKPIRYKWNEKSGNETVNIYAGFSAQNIQTAIPEAVGQMANGDLTIQDRAVIATLVNSVNELERNFQRIVMLLCGLIVIFGTILFLVVRRRA